MRIGASRQRVASLLPVLGVIAACTICADAEAARRGRGVVIDNGAGWFEENYLSPLQPHVVLLCTEDEEATVPSPANEDCEFGFRINAGGTVYDRLWVYPDGYVSPANETDEAQTFDPTHTLIGGLQGNVFAPFYSKIALGPDSNDSCQGNDEGDCELSVARYPDVGDFSEDDPKRNLRGIRVSWGLPGTWLDVAPELRTRGVRRSNDAGAPEANRFQLMLWHLAGPTDGPNDFELEFAYNTIEWEIGTPATGPRSAVGFRAGSYDLDFGNYYSTFIGQNLESEEVSGGFPSDLATCPASQASQDSRHHLSTPRFSPDDLFVCNFITVRFKSGVPSLVGYTSALDTAALNPAGPVYSGDTAELGWRVANAGPDASTNTRLTMTLPAGITFVSSPTCSLTNQSLNCPIASIAANSSADIHVTVRSNGTGVVSVEGTAAAGQYDPVKGNNLASSSADFLPNADLRIDSCTQPGALIKDATTTFSCTVTNIGPQAATDVRLVATLPTQLAFVSSSTSCIASGVTVTCSAASLASAASTTFSAVLSAPATGTGSVASTLSAQAPIDRTLTNNTASSSVSVSSSSTSSGGTSSSSSGGGGAMQWWTLAALVAFTLRRTQRSRTVIS